MYEQREYAGAAKPTTIPAGLPMGAMSFVVDDPANWQDGTDGNFTVTVRRGESDEERINCESRVGNTVTVAPGGRGWDDTTESAHDPNCAVEVTWSAQEAREANLIVAKTLGQAHAKGGLWVARSATPEDVVWKAVGPDDSVLMADSGQVDGTKWAAASTDVSDVAAVESAGVSDTWSRGDHAHTIGAGVVTPTMLTTAARRSLLLDKGSTTSDVVNTSVETNLYSLVLAGGLLAAGDVLRLRAVGEVLYNAGTGHGLQVQVKLGSSYLLSMLSTTLGSLSANPRAWQLDVYVWLNTTALEKTFGSFHLRGSTNGELSEDAQQKLFTAWDASTVEDTTTDKTLAVTAKWSTASANNRCSIHAWTLELLKAA